MIEQRTPPIEGETIADVVERSGSVAGGDDDWLELAAVVFWEESPAHRSYARFEDAVTDLTGHASVPREVLIAIQNCYVDKFNRCVDVVARAAYALGRFADRPEPERVARVKALASLVPGIEDLPVERDAETVIAAARTGVRPLDQELRGRLVESVAEDYGRTAEHGDHSARVMALADRLPEGVGDEILDATTHEQADAERYVGALAYALGRLGVEVDRDHGVPEADLARARALAGLDPLPRDEAGVRATRAWLGDWLTTHCPAAGATAIQALAALERDVPGLATLLGDPAPAGG